MIYTVNTTNRTLIIQTSFTYEQYTDLKIKYLGYNISVKDQICFELN